MADIDLRVHAKLDGSTWTDISTDVLYEEKVNIRVGAGNQGGRIDTGSCTFRLRNDDGQWTPSNPESANYPNWGRGTPVRASVYEGGVALVVEDGVSGTATTPDAAILDITGDIDVRLEMAMWNLSYPSVVDNSIRLVELIGKHDASSKSWFMAVRGGNLYFEWSTNGSNVISASSTVPLRSPGSNPRMAVRATLDTDNGSGGYTVTFYRADSIDPDAWEMVGDPVVTTSGTTSIFSGTAPLRIGDSSQFLFEPFPTGSFYKAEVRSGIGGTVVADPDFSAQASGTTSFADGAGRTWTLSGAAEITARKTRFVGEVASLSPGRDRRNFKFVDVEVGGLMRRLGANDEKLKSAVYRDMTAPGRTDLVAYWPMEDGTDATSFSSPYEGVDPAVMSAGVNPSAYTLWGASSPIPTFDSGYMLGSMPNYTATSELSTRFFVAVPSGGTAATRTLLTLFTTGTGKIWVLNLSTAGALQLIVQDQGAATLYTSGVMNFALNGIQRMLTLELTQNGADVDWTLIASTVTAKVTLNSISDTAPGVTFGKVNSVRLNDGGDFGGGAIGQLSIATDLGAYTGSSESTANWNTEKSMDRVARLCDEEGLLVDFSGFSGAPQGGQGESDLLTLLRDVADTEQALLGEARHAIGLFYRTPDSLSSQAPAFTLAYGGGELVAPFDPVYDDTQLVNDFTATRRDGGFSRYRETEGRLSVTDFPGGVGPYEGSNTFNVAYEYQTGDLAGWPVHIGTFEGARFSGIRVRVHKNLAMAADFARAYIGDVVAISGVPLDLAGTSDIKLRIEGYTESIDQYEWVIDFVMSPGEPWDTGFAGYDDTAWSEEQFSWADTESSELAEALTSTETDVDILTTAGPQWTSDPFDSPYLLEAAGEIMRVQAPGGLLNSNPFFASGITDWEAVGSTLAHETAIVPPYPDAAGSLKITPDGVTAAPGARSAHTAVGSINPGGVYVASGWLYSTTASSDVRMVVDWYDSADALLSSSTGSASTLAASEWTYISQELTAPASASRAAVRVYRGGTPAASAVTYCWAPRITRVKASTVYDSFGRTSTDTWGAADSMQSWTNTGGVAADFDVLSGYGRHIITAANSNRYSTITAPHADFDLYCDVTTAALSTGASQYAYVVARFADTSNLYMARIEFTTANVVTLTISKTVAGVTTTLDTYATGITHVAGTYVRIRFQGYGTELKAKAWLATDEEPHAWGAEASDSSLTAAGSVGVRSRRETGNTNANADIRFDNFDLITPQTFTVERSVNSVTKAQAAGEPIGLAFPAVPGI